MGNTSRKLRNSNTSPAKDALADQLPDNSMDGSSFVSVKSSFEDASRDGSESVREHDAGQFESPQQLNFYSLHASFLAEFLNSTKMDFQSGTQSCYEIVKSRLWSIYSLEYVTICALNILSILKVYGGCIPDDSKMINKKSRIMFHVLDKLHTRISQLKLGNWHAGDESLCRSCHSCDAKAMMLKHIVYRNGYVKDSFCLICLEFVPQDTSYLEHSDSNKHKKVKSRIIESIYPYPCPACLQRFSSLHLLKQHKDSHSSPVDNIEATGGEMVKFIPLCCYLCWIPFPDATHLKKHNLHSLEHCSRKEVAMEVALRNKYASVEECDVNFVESNVTENALSKLIIQSTIESPTDVVPVCSKVFDDAFEVIEDKGKNIQLKKVPTHLYECNVCGAVVPRSGVIIHERGKRHREFCEQWKAGYPLMEPTRNKDVSVQTEDSPSSVLTAKFSNLRESTNVEGYPEKTHLSPGTQCGGVCEYEGKPAKPEDDLNYYCFPCATSVPKVHLIKHENGRRHKKKLAAFNAKTNSATLITDEQVKLLIYEYLCLEEPLVYRQVGSDEYYVCEPCYLRLKYNVMLSHVIGQGHLQSAQLLDLDRSTWEKKLSLLKYLVSIRLQKWDILKVIHKDAALKFIEFESQHLEDSHEDQDQSRISSLLGSQNALKQSIDTNCTTSGINISGLHDHWISDLNELPSGALCQSSISQLKPSNDFGCSSGNASSRQDTAHISNNINSVIPHSHEGSCTSLLHSEDVESVSEAEGLISESKTDARIIGEKSGSTLQEELNSICGGKDFNDYEIQCGICRVTFQIYNVNGEEDVDFSFAMHVQNDPQHALATELPTDRNPQDMAESAKTLNLHSFSKIDKTLAFFSKVSKPIILNPKGKIKFIEELFALEQENIVTKTKDYYCKLCKVSLNTDCQFAHHLLCDKHLSLKWMMDFTDIELYQRLEKLNTLLKYKYAQLHLQHASDRIYAFLTKRNPSWEGFRPIQPSSSKAISNFANICRPASAADGGSQSSSRERATICCQFCGKNLSGMSRKSCKQHRSSCKLKGNNENVQMSMIRNAAPISAFVESKEKHFCEVCWRSMALHTRRGHEQGKSHKQNLELYHKELRKSTIKK